MLIFLGQISLHVWKLGHLSVLPPATADEATPRHTQAHRSLAYADAGTVPVQAGTRLHMNASQMGY